MYIYERNWRECDGMTKEAFKRIWEKKRNIDINEIENLNAVKDDLVRIVRGRRNKQRR